MGEVLFDVFPDGKSVLGGAPFNVAWNLQGFGLRPEFVSAVGSDDAGDRIRGRMEAWGMSTRGLQVNDHPTGEVQVQLDNGQPTFDIVAERAYDFLQSPDFSVSADDFAVFYYGTLAFRNETSRRAIQKMIAESNVPRFVDINIRQPWFDPAWLDELLQNAAWVKLSDDELSKLTGETCDNRDQIVEATGNMRSRFGGDNYLVTCGSDGAYAITQSDTLFADAPEPKELRDTVGAGDAFAAATMFGLLQGWDLLDTIKNATRYASRICEISGATCEDRSLYQSVKNGMAS
ncbi:MAG: carbohydrate kinase [Pirellulaceae bacterium]